MISIIPKPCSVVLGTGVLRLKGRNPAALVKRFDDKTIFPQGYRLNITSDGIKVNVSDNDGYFYALKTLELISFSSGGCFLPAMTVEDAPRFPFRSFMIDCCRHFFNTDELKVMIDAASKFKFNFFHWHLSNDQGWRAEVPELPELCKKGSVRSSSHFGSVYDPKPYGGYYTVADMRDIVAYCRERHIEVIPEIDIPGHVTALLSAYPELSCDGRPIGLKTTQGIFKDILCVGNEKTYDMVFQIFDSLCNIFDGKYFHIGGDEVPKDRWKSCPKCQSMKSSLGLKDEEELQGAFVNTVAEFLRQKGKKVISWNESLRGGNLDGDITVQLWMDRTDNSVKWANAGHKLILSDYYHHYMDYPYGMTPLKKVYGYDPVIKGLDHIGAASLVGLDTPIWTEHVRTLDRMTYMCYPRFIAVAERGWTAESGCDYEDFKKRLKRLLPSLDKRIRYAPEKVWDQPTRARINETVSFFIKNLNEDVVRNFLSD